MNNGEFLSGPQNPNELDPGVSNLFHDFAEPDLNEHVSIPGSFQETKDGFIQWFGGIAPITTPDMNLPTSAEQTLFEEDTRELTSFYEDRLDKVTRQAFERLMDDSLASASDKVFPAKGTSSSREYLLDSVRAATERPSDASSRKKPPLVGERYGTKFYQDRITAVRKFEALELNKSLAEALDDPQDPAQLDMTDPLVMEANTSFDTWVSTMQEYDEPEDHDQRAKNTLEITRFYVDAGFRGKDFLEDTVYDWMIQDLMYATRNCSDETIKELLTSVAEVEAILTSLHGKYEQPSVIEVTSKLKDMLEVDDIAFILELEEEEVIGYAYTVLLEGGHDPDELLLEAGILEE